MIYWTSIHLPVLTYDDLLIQFLSPFFHSPSSHSKCLLDVLKNMLSNSCRLYWSRYILLTNACTVLNILDVFNMYACTDTFLSLGRTNAKTIVSLSLNMIGDEFFARFDFFGTIIRSTRIESFPSSKNEKETALWLQLTTILIFSVAWIWLEYLKTPYEKRLWRFGCWT